MRLYEPIKSEKTEINYEPLPNGFYKVSITKCKDYEGQESRKNPGTYFSGINLTLTVIGEVDQDTKKIEHSKYEGRLIFDNIMLYARDQYGNDITTESMKKAVLINRQKIGNYLYAANISDITDTDMLLGGELVVKIKTSTPQGGTKSYTNVVSCTKISEYAADNTGYQKQEVEQPVVQTLDDGEDDGDLPF